VLERHLGEARVRKPETVLAYLNLVERERVVEVDVARHGVAPGLASTRRETRRAGLERRLAPPRRRTRVVAQGVAVTRGERVPREPRAERSAVLEQEVKLCVRARSRRRKATVSEKRRGKEPSA